MSGQKTEHGFKSGYLLRQFSHGWEPKATDNSQNRRHVAKPADTTAKAVNISIAKAVVTPIANPVGPRQ